MARQKQNDQTFETVRHFPRQPLGRRATYYIEVSVARNYDDPHGPLCGCTLVEPIDDADKALLVRMGLARFDGAGRFEPDFPAMRAHLQGVLRWSDATIAGATWPTILSTLRDHEQPQAKPEPLSRRARIVYERLLALKAHEAMTFPEIQDYYESQTEKNLDEGTWKDLRRELEPYGLANKRKVGYYIRPPKK